MLPKSNLRPSNMKTVAGHWEQGRATSYPLCCHWATCRRYFNINQPFNKQDADTQQEAKRKH